MKQAILKAVAVVSLVGSMALGIQMAPASASPADVNLATNTMSAQYNVNGCLYRVRYGNFGPTAYAQMRIYNPASCLPASVSIGYHDGTNSGATNKAFTSTNYTVGTDGCGSYREIQVNASAPVAFATHVVTVVPAATGWDGIRVYAADGQMTQPIHATC